MIPRQLLDGPCVVLLHPSTSLTYFRIIFRQTPFVFNLYLPLVVVVLIINAAGLSANRPFLDALNPDLCMYYRYENHDIELLVTCESRRWFSLITPGRPSLSKNLSTTATSASQIITRVVLLTASILQRIIDSQQNSIRQGESFVRYLMETPTLFKRWRNTCSNLYVNRILVHIVASLASVHADKTAIWSDLS